MQYSKMKESIEIFEKYDLNDEFFEADHDIIYGPSLDVEFSEEDKQKLDELGWIQMDEYDCWSCYC